MKEKERALIYFSPTGNMLKTQGKPNHHSWLVYMEKNKQGQFLHGSYMHRPGLNCPKNIFLRNEQRQLFDPMTKNTLTKG